MFINDADYVFVFNIFFFCKNKFVLLLKIGKNNLDKRKRKIGTSYTYFHCLPCA